MGKLYVGARTQAHSFLLDGNIFDFSPRRENIIKRSSCSLLRIQLILRQRHSIKEKGSTLLVETPDATEVFFCRGMPASSKYISQVVLISLTIIISRNSMVISTINSLSAATSCKIHTKPCATFLFGCVCFCVPCMLLRIALVQSWHSLWRLFLHVCKVFVIPNVILIIALEVGYIVF